MCVGSCCIYLSYVRICVTFIRTHTLLPIIERRAYIFITFINCVSIYTFAIYCFHISVYFIQAVTMFGPVLVPAVVVLNVNLSPFDKETGVKLSFVPLLPDKETSHKAP